MGDGSELADAVDEALRLLPVLVVLVGAHDADGTSAHGLNHVSAPPWNSAVAHVKLDLHQGSRDLEADLYREVTGAERRPRGGSDWQTVGALRSIAYLGGQVDHRRARSAAYAVGRWCSAARRLPAVDEEPVWRRLLPGPDGLPPMCPYCGTYSLRVAVRSRVVRCFYPGACRDALGDRPVATLELGRISLDPMLVWSDGTVQLPP